LGSLKPWHQRTGHAPSGQVLALLLLGAKFEQHRPEHPDAQVVLRLAAAQTRHFLLEHTLLRRGSGRRHRIHAARRARTSRGRACARTTGAGPRWKSAPASRSSTSRAGDRLRIDGGQLASSHACVSARKRSISLGVFTSGLLDLQGSRSRRHSDGHRRRRACAPGRLAGAARPGARSFRPGQHVVHRVAQLREDMQLMASKAVHSPLGDEARSVSNWCRWWSRSSCTRACRPRKTPWCDGSTSVSGAKVEPVERIEPQLQGVAVGLAGASPARWS
jgi:hypothetical protein